MSADSSTPSVRCPDCWNGKPIPCSVGCRDADECCNKRLDFPCKRCNGSGWLKPTDEEDDLVCSDTGDPETCADPACPKHGDDPSTLVPEGEDIL